MKNFVVLLLQRRAKAVLQKFQPLIVAITGSYGKTSVKQAVRTAISESVSVRSAQKNYNNEIGVPLTILGETSPGRSVWGWLKLLWNSYRIKSYPDVLVLEFGIDHPGDMQKLCDLATPDIGVVTGVSTVHAEYFKNLDELANEKAKLISCVPQQGLVVLNADDKRAAAMRGKTAAAVLTYGSTAEDISADNIRVATRIDDSFEPGEEFVKTTADVYEDGALAAKLRLTNLIGYAPVLACLAGVAVARAFDISPSEAVDRLNRSMEAVPGRLNPIAGIKGTLIIDDTYNAAPAAVHNGLRILRLFEPGEEFDRRIAVIGYMAELGQYSEKEHRLVGMKVSEVADVFVAVGEPMNTAVRAAKEAGMDPDRVEWFSTSAEAGRYLDKTVQQGDVLYVKGSQSAGMEKAVKDVMAEPLRAAELLVRQGPEWREG